MESTSPISHIKIESLSDVVSTKTSSTEIDEIMDRLLNLDLSDRS